MERVVEGRDACAEVCGFCFNLITYLLISRMWVLLMRGRDLCVCMVVVVVDVKMR